MTGCQDGEFMFTTLWTAFPLHSLQGRVSHYFLITVKEDSKGDTMVLFSKKNV